MPLTNDKILYRTSFGYLFFCPGCREGHGVWVDKPNDMTGAKWTFDGNESSPTFSPSIVVGGPGPRCHCFVRGGKIEFLSDCGHALAGQTVPMEPF